MDYTALAAELTTGHPDTGPYDADAQLAADQINAENRSRIRASMTGAEIWLATVATDYAGLSDVKRSQWLSFCSITDHNPEAGGLAQLFVIDMFGAASPTVAALGTQRNETVSRAVELGWGRVRAADIIEARAI